uniref:KIB1-4 beta-propeller domain-containing protein n=1 Tax=Oryza meridionalis TaxID=40149 RepID=A0A0E0F5D1_9ORYZ
MASSSSHGLVLPCLAVECSCCRPNTTFISAAEKKLVAAAAGLPSELLDVKATVCPTPLGWILVRESVSGSTYLVDPQSRQDKIPLPPLTGIDDDVLMDCNCLLSDQPSAQAAAGCVVLLVEPQDTVIWYHHIGSGGGGGEWTRHEYDIGVQGDKYGFTEKIHIVPIAACRGKFYFNSFFTEISVLEFCGPAGSPRFSSIRLAGGAPGDWGRGAFHVFLLESDGELYMVRLKTTLGSQSSPASSSSSSPSPLQVGVYKMDFSERRWCRADDLGDRAFFVAPFYFGASCVAGGKYGIQKNCVYSIRYLGDESFTVSNVEDGTSYVHSIHGAETSPDSILRTLWMLPTDQKP